MSVLVSFVLVFAVIAGLEFADRTNFALISLAAKEPPRAVWAGAAAAFVVTTALAVVIGTALVAALPAYLVDLRLAGGALLLGYAGYLLWHREADEPIRTRRSAGLTAFVLILLLELGDTTMIFTINFVFTVGNPLLVGIAAGLGLITVAATASLIGSRVGVRLEPAKLDRLVIAILTAVGVLTIVYALWPGWFPSIG